MNLSKPISQDYSNLAPLAPNDATIVKFVRSYLTTFGQPDPDDSIVYIGSGAEVILPSVNIKVSNATKNLIGVGFRRLPTTTRTEEKGTTSHEVKKSFAIVNFSFDPFTPNVEGRTHLSALKTFKVIPNELPLESSSILVDSIKEILEQDFDLQLSDQEALFAANNSIRVEQT